MFAQAMDRLSAFRVVAGLLLALLCAAILSLALGAAPAFALNGPSHALVTTYGAAASSPVDPYPLSQPNDVEIDQTTHDLYVTDTGNHRIEKLDSGGHFILMFGRGVDQTTGGNVCTAASGDTCKVAAPGPSPGSFEEPAYIAVDNSHGPSAGDVYVADKGDNLVTKFDSSGHVISSWGESGQKKGSEAKSLGGTFAPIFGVAVNSANGNLVVGGAPLAECCGAVDVWEYTQDGTYLEPYRNSSRPWLKIEPNGNLLSGTPYALDPNQEELFQNTGDSISHFAGGTLRDEFGSGDLLSSGGIAVDGGTQTVYAANGNPPQGSIAVFKDARPEVTTGRPIAADETSITLAGQIDPETNGENHGAVTSCQFEYGFTSAYGHTAPCEPDPETGPPFTATQAVTAQITGLTPIANLPVGTEYHYRLVASNVLGATGEGSDQTGRTTAPPQIESLFSSHVAATSAELDASIASNGRPTKYHFEYGTTTAYGNSTPEEEISGAIGPLFEAHSIKAVIEELQSGFTYHFRLVAENELGPIASEDQTFEFFPPNCPNAAVRQQTSANYLPDCRAYELVSPANANGTLFYPGGPNTGQATSPSRFSYTGLWSEIPGANAINTGGDLYVATRTDQGWKSNYVGIHGNEAGCAGGPPTDPGSGLTFYNPATLTNTVQSDPSMSRFLDWSDGPPIFCTLGANGVGDGNYRLAPSSIAPYLWSVDGSFIQRLPTNLGEVPNAEKAFECPYAAIQEPTAECGGESRASGDLSHIAFSSNRLSFAGAEGLTQAPGSAYDNDVKTGTVKLISKLANGESIAQDPSFSEPKEFIRFPAISEDGSHILMSTSTVALEPFCGSHDFDGGFCAIYQESPLHLYMSIDDAPAIDVSQGHAVHYVGTTPDLSKVYFSSEEKLLPEDEDESSDLYMWSQRGEAEGHPLTLISKGDNPGNPGEAGNSDSCEASWIARCGAIAWSNYPFRWAGQDLGGNGLSDSPIAANGDVYFYSPEQLDGNHGVPGKQNLYVYREGKAQFVAPLEPGQKCEKAGYSSEVCSEGPIVRMEVTPNDSQMAFVTASHLTSFDSSGHEEMYSYSPASGNLVCDSCRPDGGAATANAYASQDGRFVTDDGRAFFSTTEALVRQDTDEGEDVYEYVDGRPQLISTGTGTATAPEGEQTGNGKGVNGVSISQAPGFVGVSADGTDVYFSTFDTLVAEDHNGNFLKFYDARTNGGFAQPTPTPPCAAAEECHGAGSAAPALPGQGTAAGLSGGNAKVKAQAKKHKKKHKKKRQHRKAAKRQRARPIHANRGGAR